MNERVFLLFLGCVMGLVTSLPLSPSLQILLPEMDEVDKNTLSVIKEIQEDSQPEKNSQAVIKEIQENSQPDNNVQSVIKEIQEHSQPARKSKSSDEPQGTFSRIINVNKDSDTAMHGGDMLVKSGRSATSCTACLWPKNADGTVPVPYNITSPYNSNDMNTIITSMKEFETLTCVRFVPRNTENDYLNIVAGSSCSSFVGKIGGGQTVSLGGGCMYRGIVQHELSHALGFFHEHMRSDRDTYVDIMYQYIDQAYWGNFAKVNTNNLGLEYDFSSVMHYDGYAFSNTSNQPTIVPKPDPTVPIGQRDGLSILDVSKINRLYQCSVCATLLNDKNGTFTSANYPSAYPNNVNCVWLIRTPSGQASLTFNGFDVQSTPNCTSDYMRIYDGPTKNSPVLLDKKCGSQIMPPVIASTSQMLVEFVSDNDVAGVGWKATYSSVQCGGTFYNFKGTFTSPGYPNPYGSDMSCTYTITAPVGSKIALSISDFHVEAGSFCIYDSLKIFMDGKQRGPFCGEISIPTLSTMGNSMVLVFKSDSYTEMKGFKASYTFF